MTRLALVRVERSGLGWPGHTLDPDGLIGYYEVRNPRRYAVVTDATAWEAWVKEHAPEEIWPCGHIDKGFESAVRKWVALCGTWKCAHCPNDDDPEGSEVAPDGMEVRSDSAYRIRCVTPHGVWESPLDLAEAS